ncbi:unnamed protein product [Chironomus riparius]|uniref:NADH dehydrogenase subunit 4L n=1 Tax=Chironomus riparius TaxID=315576 RepID=A0A9N9RPK5_9DIPT|nr:unnamed protein product [Chironomus riparius]
MLSLSLLIFLQLTNGDNSGSFLFLISLLFSFSSIYSCFSSFTLD